MKQIVMALPLFLFLSSCGDWNKKIPETRSISDDHKRSSFQIKEDKLRKLRQDFAITELEQMRSQIRTHINTYRSIQTLSQNIKSKTGEAALSFVELERNFVQTWGERGKEVQKTLNGLQVKFENKKTEFNQKKITLENKKEQFDNLVQNFNECKQDVEAQKTSLESRASVIRTILNGHTNQINQLRARISNEQAAVADNKRRKNQSNWPPDKKKYATRARKHANKAKKLVGEAQSIANRAITRRDSFQNEIQPDVIKAQNKANECRAIADEGQSLRDQIITDGESLTALNSTIMEIVAESEQIKSDNRDFFDALTVYESELNQLTHGVQERINEMVAQFEIQKDLLVENYGENFVDTFDKLKNWHEGTTISGRSSLDLINHLKHIAPSTKKLQAIVDKMILILQTAADQVSLVSMDNNRRIASIISDLIGIDINISNIGHITVDLPNFDFKLQEIKIVSLTLGNLNFNLPNISDLNLGVGINSLESLQVDIKLPEVNIIHLSVGLEEDVERFFDLIANFSIKTPDVEIIRIEADIEGDVRNPGRVYDNAGKALTKAREDADRELTNAYQNAKKTHDKAQSDLQREVGVGLNKTGKALEAAGQPENLARIALVYAATMYAGPLGSALANSLLDKMQNPGMSDKDLFESFVVGAAAGYAAQGATELPIESMQSMPSVSSALARNLTTDIGNVLIRGENYSTEQFLTSVATAGLNVNTGDRFATEVFDSAVNEGASYSVTALINKEKFDLEKFEEHIYRGMANGFTRESMHALMDEYVVKYIPRDQDKRLFEFVGNVVTEIFVVQDQSEFELQMDKFKNLSVEEQSEIIQKVNEINQKHREQLAQLLNKDVEELTAFDLSSSESERIYKEQLRVYIEEVDPNGDSSISKLDLTREEEAEIIGRGPKSWGKVLVISLSVYGYYQTVNEAERILNNYEKYHAETGKGVADFIKENPSEFQDLSLDAALALLPQVKSVAKVLGITSEVATRVVVSARKSGLTDGTKLKGVMDSFKRFLLDEAGHIDPKSIIEIFEGSAKAGWNMTKKVADDLGELVKKIRKSKKLPDNYISKEQAKKLGWDPKKGNLHEVAPGKSIGGDIWKNRKGQLPQGKTYYEADLGYKNGYRGKERLLWSNDGKLYITNDHYESFTEIIE